MLLAACMPEYHMGDPLSTNPKAKIAPTDQPLSGHALAPDQRGFGNNHVELTVRL